jgi:hypothetical protein
VFCYDVNAVDGTVWLVWGMAGVTLWDMAESKAESEDCLCTSDTRPDSLVGLGYGRGHRLRARIGLAGWTQGRTAWLVWGTAGVTG